AVARVDEVVVDVARVGGDADAVAAGDLRPPAVAEVLEPVGAIRRVALDAGADPHVLVAVHGDAVALHLAPLRVAHRADVGGLGGVEVAELAAAQVGGPA